MGSGKMYCPGLSDVKLLRNHCWAKTGGKCVVYLPILLIPAVDHCPDLDGKKGHSVVYSCPRVYLWVV